MEKIENTHFDDEIDMFELWDTIVSGWKTIAATMVAVLLLAGVFISVSEPVYESKAIMIKPYSSDYSSLKLLPSIAVDNGQVLYAEFRNQLNSDGVVHAILNDKKLNQVFADYYGFTESVQIKDFLNKHLQINFPKTSGKDSNMKRFDETVLTLDFINPQKAASILRFIVTNANELAVDQFITDWKATLDKQLQAEKQKYNLIDQKIKLQTQSEILRLKDSFDIAKKLGIFSPVDPAKYGEKIQDSRANIDISMQNSLQGYWFGTKVLKAEIDRLEARKNNLPYSQVLRDSLAQQKKLRQQLTNLGTVKFQTYSYKQLPTEPLKPIKPKSRLILAVAVVMAMFLGVFFVLIKAAYQRRKAELS
jgi:LPS O-antigen subunit length determinant protein (WzzB/FepE family)